MAPSFTLMSPMAVKSNDRIFETKNIMDDTMQSKLMVVMLQGH